MNAEDREGTQVKKTTKPVDHKQINQWKRGEVGKEITNETIQNPIN